MSPYLPSAYPVRRQLVLTANKLNGTIPEGISALSRLTCVGWQLAACSLLSAADRRLSEVIWLRVSRGVQKSLTLSVLPDVATRYLNLAVNSFTGTLSPGISGLTRLRYFFALQWAVSSVTVTTHRSKFGRQPKPSSFFQCHNKRGIILFRHSCKGVT